MRAFFQKKSKKTTQNEKKKKKKSEKKEGIFILKVKPENNAMLISHGVGSTKEYN
jgi:hypothetical protein